MTATPINWSIKGQQIYLASASQTRVQLLQMAGLVFQAKPASIDEEAIKQAGIAEEIAADDIAITLAELKAEKIARQYSGYIIGSDQLLTCEGVIFSKPKSEQQAAQHLTTLSGKTHRLHNAVVVFQNGRRIWHHCSHADLTMRRLDAQDISDYLSFCGKNCLSSPGCYQIEGAGAQLFTEMKGVYYDILGLPLLPLLAFLREHGLRPFPDETGSDEVGPNEVGQ